MSKLKWHVHVHYARTTRPRRVRDTQIRQYCCTPPSLSLRIFTNLATKEYDIDVVGEHNPPQNCRPHRLCLPPAPNNINSTNSNSNSSTPSDCTPNTPTNNSPPLPPRLDLVEVGLLNRKNPEVSRSLRRGLPVGDDYAGGVLERWVGWKVGASEPRERAA
jgi:hypothetical protein